MIRFVIWQTSNCAAMHPFSGLPIFDNKAVLTDHGFQLNVLAELTLFADRGFYADWWNSTSWDQFARDWNRPVHNFLLRFAYHSSITTLRLSRSTATLLTFFLSACVHELVVAVIFGKVRGYLLALQMLQLPLVMLSRTKFLKGKNILGLVVCPRCGLNLYSCCFSISFANAYPQEPCFLAGHIRWA